MKAGLSTRRSRALLIGTSATDSVGERAEPSPVLLSAHSETVAGGAKMPVRQQRQVSTEAVTSARDDCSTPIWVRPGCWPLRARAVTRSARISWPHSAPSSDLAAPSQVAAGAAMERPADLAVWPAFLVAGYMVAIRRWAPRPPALAANSASHVRVGAMVLLASSTRVRCRGRGGPRRARFSANLPAWNPGAAL